MRKCNVHWFADENGEMRWRCNQYFMSNGVDFRKSSDRCYHYRCPGRQEWNAPPKRLCAHSGCANTLKTQSVYCSIACKKEDLKLCKREGCTKKIRPPKQKHCSEACRNRAKSKAYRNRKKRKK